MKLTLKKAFELSIEKWEWIVKNNGYEDTSTLIDDIPSLKGLHAQCGLCQKYHEAIVGQRDGCKNCPLLINVGYCMTNLHPYYEWRMNSNKGNAKAVLSLINEKYAAHLKRYYK